MPKTLAIKGLAYHAVHFQKPLPLFQIFPETWANKLWCETL
jgi:hypothetical protein